MKTTIKLVYEYECSNLGDYGQGRKVEVTLDAQDMQLPELLEQMDLFVKACGYVPPETNRKPGGEKRNGRKQKNGTKLIDQ